MRRTACLFVCVVWMAAVPADAVVRPPSSSDRIAIVDGTKDVADAFAEDGFSSKAIAIDGNCRRRNAEKAVNNRIDVQWLSAECKRPVHEFPIHRWASFETDLTIERRNIP